jgi:hypothetical protein
MNPDLNGQSAVLAKTRPYLVLATDRHRCGQPLRALTEEGQHLLTETRHTKFVRFETREEAEAWLGKMQPKLVSITSDYVYTITTL